MISLFIPILERFLSLSTDEVNLIIGSEQEAATFKTKLKYLQEGLQDAEKKQVTKSNVKSWLQELKDVICAMDDTLDEWQIFNAWKKEERSIPWCEVLSTMIQDLCLGFDRIHRQRELTLEMKSLLKTLDELLDNKNRYNFVPNQRNQSKQFVAPETTSEVAKTVSGRDSDLKELLSALLDLDNGESTSTSIRVVSLWGAGGLGKTTLSQLAYNDQRVDDHFETKLWVSVSKPFDASQVARGILEAADQEVYDISTLEALTYRVKRLVSNKKFFLVLDNVWWDDSDQWETLMNCLHGAPGSRILVTTREEKVVPTMTRSYKWINLLPLSNTECWEILNDLALTGKTTEEIDMLTPIGVNIAKKCGGFPLAAKVLGGKLACLKTEKQWREVLESPMLDGVGQLHKSLNLSYNDLSPTLKLCFSSFAIFPKGDSIRRDELIRIWLSKGYLSLDDGAEKVQLVGEEYFNDLAMRSFFQEANDESCKIHDVMHDFAVHLEKNEYCYTFDGKAEGENKMDYSSSNNSKMRTFVVRNVSISQLHLLHLATSLKKAKLLILKDCHLKEIPEELGKLVHLRYLDLSRNDMKELPETLCDLYHLQTLCLQYCRYLSMLPERIDKLVNLRNISFSGTNIKFPRGLKNLKCLWILDGVFRVGRGCSNKLGYLKNLNKLHGLLRVHIMDMYEEADVEEAKEAYLGKKEKIIFLQLIITGEVSKNVIEALLPPTCNLKCLLIDGGKLEWLSSLINLRKLPSLKELTVCFMFGRSLGVSARFPNLKRLNFAFCNSWEKWEDIGENELYNGFPHLQELEIICCDRLEVLPHNFIGNLSSLQTLTISKSKCLKEAYREGGLHRHNISRISNIYIR